MTTIDRKTVMEKYDEFSRLETLGERRELFGKQSEEMRVALWLENIDRKTKGIELSAEQKKILDVIKRKFITVEFAESARGKSEEEAGPEYHEIMGKASQLLGKDNLRELFVILGDSNTLRMGC
jgi:hypothetical protein